MGALPAGITGIGNTGHFPGRNLPPWMRHPRGPMGFRKPWTEEGTEQLGDVRVVHECDCTTVQFRTVIFENGHLSWRPDDPSAIFICR